MPSSVEHKALVVRPRTQDCSPTPTSAQLSSLQLQQQLKTFPVLANFYRIAVSDIVVQHYDVAISVVKRWQIKPQPQSTQPKQSKQKVSKSSEPAAVMEKGAVKVEKAVPAAAAADDDDQKADLFVKKFSSEVFAAFQKDHPGYFTNSSTIYDGYKALYSVRLLPIPPEQEFTQKALIQGRERTFKVKIKHVERIDLSAANDFFEQKVSEIPERVFSVLEIIFKRLITDAGYTAFQRKYFDVGGERENFRNIYDLVRGFLCGVRQTQFGLALNVHLKATAIISKSFKRLDHLVAKLLELNDARELEQRMPLKFYQLAKVNETIKSLVIYVCHGQKMNFKVAKLTNETPERYQFEYSENKSSPPRMITTYEYFRLKYPNVKINPRLPMVMLTKKKTYMPLDLCLIKDVHFLSTRLLAEDTDVQSKLLTFSTLSPTVYFNSTHKIVNQIAAGGANSSKADEVKRDFGLEQFSLEAVRLNAHQLNEPIVHNTGPRDRFFQPQKEAIKFAVVCLDPWIKPEQLKGFVDEMIADSKTKGLKMENIRALKIVRQDELRCAQDVKKVCNQIDKSGGLNYVFFVFPSGKCEVCVCVCVNVHFKFPLLTFFCIILCLISATWLHSPKRIR